MEEETDGDFSNEFQTHKKIYHSKVNPTLTSGFSTVDQEPGHKVTHRVIRPKMANSQFGNGAYVGNDDVLSMVFVGELDWWTTDAEVEDEVCKYGNVKEVKFYEEKMSGKSKGYCRVLFYEPSAAIACRDGMNGHVFNGRKCVVQCGRPFISYNYNVNKKKYDHGSNNQVVVKTNGVPWKKVNAQRIGGRGQGVARMVGDGIGNWMSCTQTMTGQGFDPSCAVNMGGMVSYGGFLTSPAAPIMSSFPGVGLSEVAPYVSANGIAVVPTTSGQGNGKQMWFQKDEVYGYVNHDREGQLNVMNEKDRGLERDWCDSFNRQFRDDGILKSDGDVPREKDNVSKWRPCYDKGLYEKTELPREGDAESDRYIDELFSDLSILDQPPELPLSQWSSIR